MRSFRDPAGRLFELDGRVLRLVTATGVDALRAFLGSPVARALVEAGHLVGTRVLDPVESLAIARTPPVRRLLEDVDGRFMLVEHDRIAFPSFPYEWPPEMLHAAADLTLRVATHSLTENLGLKDATPYNILFRGPGPVFVDLLSFELRDARDPIWLPYAQFVRTFLLPLAANTHLDLPLDLMAISRRDGLEPAELYRWLTPIERIRRPFLTLASIPTWLNVFDGRDDGGVCRTRVLKDDARARFILDALFSRLRRALQQVAPTRGKVSHWSHYRDDVHSDAYVSMKEQFVARAIDECRPKRVLDVGANTGSFSRIAAAAGASVVSIDRDPTVLGDLWRLARSLDLDILPLQIDIARPSPAVGWRNREYPSFLDRARGAFDAVLMLAILHHLLVAEGIPLDEVLNLAAELTTDLLIIEFVATDDPMFHRLARGRDDLHTGLTRRRFELACRRRFRVVRAEACPGGSRWLYLLRAH